MLVKICGITNESDAMLAVGLGAGALGFVFAPSSRQMAVKAVARIVDRLPHDILTVGVFRNEAPARVVQMVNEAGLRAAQLHGEESVDACRYVSERVPVVLKAFPAGHPGIAHWRSYGADLVLIDSGSPGSGSVFDWKLAESVVEPDRIVIAGGLNPSNVTMAIERLRPFGVDVSSGVEIAPGRKDPRKLRDFLVAVRNAEAALGLPGEDVSSSGRYLYDWADEEENDD
ncbi:MAG: phosphoribosylanthranilate isomerase [Actinobacteria bacterium]|jgi:phosphoribosylanthranilate isomerase|nr:phosphoribosylanthranilate isomerase [Actinomycetota bacterium]